MRAHFPRCYVDVNREPYELDPRMFEGRLPSFANTRSMRVAGGLGTVARVVGDAQEIYGQRIPVDDAIRRIEGLYKPYHRALRRLFTRVHRDFGAAVLIDCHSMPSTAGSKDERPRADVVLGDRYGTSCVTPVAETIEQTLRGLGYSVSRNKPYAGGFITEHYGNPAAGPACDPARAQPGALHGRAALRALAVVCSAWRRDLETLAERLGAPSRSRSCALSGRRRISRRVAIGFAIKEKGPLARGKRPKSREETPKEGGGNARRYRTAIRYTAVHKKQG